MNFDLRIKALLKQQRERPEKFSALTGYRDLNDPFRSLFISRVPPQMLSIALPVPFARSYTLTKHEDV